VTTGLGLGNSTVEALLSGLYEVVERDAMMLSWYSSFDPLALAVEEPDFETMVQRARSEGLEVTTFLLTQDIDVPVVAAAVHREEWPRFALGTGADLDPAGAARSALAEALQNWMELRGMGADDAAEAMGAIGRYAADPDPVSPFVGADAEIPAGTAGPDEIESGVAELQELLDRIHAAETEMDVYGAKTTTRGVEQLGFEAVRALIPQAQPLTFGSAYFGDRARTVPEALGFEPELDRDHHPFP
jgi:ribosomal protein S12 methylthiotransferase accessory factor